MSPIRAAIVPVTPFQQNTSLVWCEKTMKAAFVDPGGEVPKLLDAVRQTGVSVEKILLTHGHLDHAGAAAEISETLGVPIEGPHRDEDWLLAKLEQSAAKYGMKDARGCTPTRWLDDGDTVTVGEVSFDVFHCPGHTPGHVVFVQKEARIAFVGDVLFKGSIGRTDLERGNFESLISAIRTKLFPLGDDIQFVSGHGEMSTFGWERKCNPFVSDLAVGEG
ncbi:MAG: beta-lactamase domain-containing protein [Alphaproteobacteria bacterium]|nr:MAG: beta-lactamase domain-containing protein [Caulobacteraceae bacterium]TPW03853.1 MAG: beta-lactamase domain-containing protein [Alphaproteobacteria bacterium]